MDVSSGDYYRRLRVSRTASPKEIKLAFRRLARQYHPDLHPNQPNASAKFQALREAYEVLSDRIRRQNYDECSARPDYFSAPFSDSFIDSGETYQRQRDPQTPTDFYIRGIRRALAHRYADALKDYSQAIALDASFAEAYLRRAEVHHLLENDSGVLADCQRAIALDPTESKPYYYQGLARYRLGYVQSAIAAFSEAIVRDPEDARYYNGRAIAAQDLDDIDDAVQDFRRAASLYRSQGDMANYRDIQQTLVLLGTDGRAWPYRLLGRLVKRVLGILVWPLSQLFGRRLLGSRRFRRPTQSSSSGSAARPSPSASSGSPSATNRPGGRDPVSTRTRPSSPHSEFFRKPFKAKVYWAPGVSSRPTEPADVPRRPLSGVMTSLKLLSNPAGEMVAVYEQLPRRKRGLVGYGLAVLANLCFVLGATQYFANSSWLLASCLWAAGGLMFVGMVLVLSVVRVWMRVQGVWNADIFMLGTTMVPLGLLAIAGGFIPVLTQSLAEPWDQAMMAIGLLVAVFWAFSQAVIALHNGLYHIHQFSGQTAAWLSPVILGLGLSAGVGTGYFLAQTLLVVSVAIASV